MVPYMGWILLCYGLAAVLVHMLHRFYSRRKPNSHMIHYVLVTRNHEGQMEWYLRALSWYARLRGLSLQVTVLDEGSKDDTLAIARRLQAQDDMELTVIGLTVVRQEDVEEQTAQIKGANPVYVDLRIPQEADKIPYVHV
ncbi:hypothetical protein ACFQ3W_25205 [Paenibacillus puldeungensis]|uniref:Glycosyl transferase family 2 n=2 Tax=Paenibacillus puldeungensis TaxID=696536 RepID=A0ABW3S5W5_9BACL